MVWSKSFGGVQSDMAYAVASAVDGCLVVGDTHSSGAGDSDALVMKISSDGSLVWQKTFGGADFDAPTCVAVAQDGGFLVGGTTFSFGNGVRDFWLFKVGVEGEVLWSCTVGRGGYEEAYGVVDVGGGDLVLAGWTNSLGLGRYSFYVVKVAVDSR